MIRSVSPVTTSPVRSDLLFCILIVFLAFAVRLHNLGGDSFWVDEISTTLVTEQGWRVAIVGNRTHPGLFFFLATVSSLAFGESEFSLRLPSLIAGTLAIPLIILAGKMLGRPSVGLWAGLLLALAPFHLRYSQETRMYAQLMTFSLLSSIFLYKAIKQAKWSLWLAYTTATVFNLYTHYGALIVLAAQCFLIAGWVVTSLYEGRRRLLIYPITSGFLILLIYLPWIPRFLESLQYNVGDDVLTDTGVRQPIRDWVRIAYHEFAMYDDFLAIIFLGLCLLGFITLILQKRWLNVAWLASGLILPIGLIYVFQIARGAYSRYVIYLLPFFLLAVAYAIDTLLKQVNKRTGRRTFTIVILVSVSALVILGGTKVLDEYAFIKEDWRGIVSYLEQNSSGGDVVLSITLNWPNPFNFVSHALPTYLEQAENSFTFLRGNRVDPAAASTLVDREGTVWAVISQWADQPRFNDKSLKVAHFQNNLHVVHDLKSGRSALSDAIELYEAILPLAFTPMPQCLLRQDLSSLYVAAEEYWIARRYLDEAIAQCPDPSGTAGTRSTLTQQIVSGFKSQDWSSFVDDLEQIAHDGAVFLGISLYDDNDTGHVTGVLPYYLERSGWHYKYYTAHLLDSKELDALANERSDLWFVVGMPPDAAPLTGIPNKGIEVLELEDGVILLHFSDQEGLVLERIIDTYWNWLLPLVEDQNLSCRLMKEIARMSDVAGDYLMLARIVNLRENCTEPLVDPGLEKRIHQGLRDNFEKNIQSSDMDKARETAVFLIEYDPKDSVALELATADNLMERFLTGEVIMAQNNAPEPIDLRQFAMPHNGDWGEVIFIHPPASVSFQLDLPDRPTALLTRVALDPQSWEWPGDGVTFVATVQEGSSEPIEVFRHHLANDNTGHDWHSVRVPLAPFAGKQVLLTLSTEAGPAGDGTGDWAGWETPRLIWFE